jgi:hypothetical protein
VDPVGAWTTIAASAALVLIVVFTARDRLLRRWIMVLVALGGAGVGLGGLLLLDDVGPASWVAAPAVLAAAAVGQERFLFAPGGPFRT